MNACNPFSSPLKRHHGAIQLHFPLPTKTFSVNLLRKAHLSSTEGRRRSDKLNPSLRRPAQRRRASLGSTLASAEALFNCTMSDNANAAPPRPRKKAASFQASWATPVILQGGMQYSQAPPKPQATPAPPQPAAPAPPPAAKSSSLQWKNPTRGWHTGGYPGAPPQQPPPAPLPPLNANASQSPAPAAAAPAPAPKQHHRHGSESRQKAQSKARSKAGSQPDSKRMCMPSGNFWDDPLCNLPFCATDRREQNMEGSPHAGRRPVAAPWNNNYGHQPTPGWQQHQVPQQGQGQQQGGQQAYASGNTPPGGFGFAAPPPPAADEMLVDELLQQEGERGLWSLVTDLFSGVGGGAASEPVLPVLSPTALNGELNARGRFFSLRPRATGCGSLPTPRAHVYTLPSPSPWGAGYCLGPRFGPRKPKGLATSVDAR